MNRLLVPATVLALLFCLVAGVAAEDEATEVARLKDEMELRARVPGAVERGVAWLKAQQEEDGSIPKPAAGALFVPNLPGGHFGETALAAYTLAHCGVPAADPVLTRAFGYLRKEYRRVMKKGFGMEGPTYSMALLLMALHAYYRLDDVARVAKPDPKKNPLGMPGRDLAIVRRVGAWFLKTRMDDGLFSYGRSKQKIARRVRLPKGVAMPTPRSDLSNTQYALLAVWTAARCGVPVPAEALVEIAEALLAWQDKTGPAVRRVLDPTAGERVSASSTDYLTDRARGFTYTPRTPTPVVVMTSGSMTTAGLSSLLIAKAILDEQGRLDERLARRLTRGAWDAIAWLAQHYDIKRNPIVTDTSGMSEKHRALWAKHPVTFERGWFYYYLYGMERAMVIAGKRYLGTHDWWLEGAAHLLAGQTKQGTWSSMSSFPAAVVPKGARPVRPPLIDTCFALLFLKRATLRPRAPLLRIHAVPKEDR